MAKALRWCRIKQVYLMLFDILAANAAFFIGLWMRYDFVWSNIPAECITVYRRCLLSYSVLVMLVFQMLHLYKSIWRYASYNELHKLIVGNFITTVFHYLVVSVSAGYMPVSYFMIGPMLQFFFTVGIRFSYRFVYLMSHMRTKESKKVSSRNAMIIGAGSAGRILVRDILSSSETNLVPCCIIDDDPGKWGCFIDGIPVLGGRDDILINVEKYDIKQILFVIPTATAQQKRDILNICNETGCELKSLPGIYQLVNGEVSLTKMKDVAVEDLLGREPIRVNMDEIFESLGGKTILVTGGGGSIGSELCRQIAVQSPKRLIIFDVYENNAYDIEQELRRKIPDLNLTVLIGSVRDTRRINSVFAQYKPDIVYHAAAHKHVPLMETSPCEAIKNNVLGTYKTAYAALKYGCKRFVLISTDKAVNPTNIMGASKRLCEMVIQTMDAVSKAGRFEMLPNLRSYKEAPKNSTGRSANLRSISKDGNQSGKLKQNKTDFVAVRFGNVLGSNGSVVPLFKKQIENGGPVTVTHPDIIRYFMTIPEAVSLVLQAGTYAKGGEIFVLDMGAPVKIDTLARNLIKLSGHKIDEIRIVYTGLRPGEKLYEEKLMEEEGMKKTPNDLIHIGKPIPFDMEEFWEKLEKLTELSYSNSLKTIDMVADMVPTFHSAEEDLERSGDTFKELYEEAAEVKSKKHKRKANIASY
ncbi:polysaccharide biosynthesis protein [[Clostridium] polysaccharolyticum]|uniref:polysaccharide biosynthesis protein n=1 Tax=[Clostridium] polysaccharolyticum TaxID=29364 RepID=UPI0038CD74CE